MGRSPWSKGYGAKRERPGVLAYGRDVPAGLLGDAMRPSVARLDYRVAMTTPLDGERAAGTRLDNSNTLPRAIIRESTRFRDNRPSHPFPLTVARSAASWPQQRPVYWDRH